MRSLIISLVIILSALAFTGGLLLNVETVRLNDENVALTEIVTGLREENTRLKIQLAFTTPLSELEDKARNEYGMLPPDSAQSIAIETEKTDKAVILDSPETWISSFLNILK